MTVPVELVHTSSVTIEEINKDVIEEIQRWRIRSLYRRNHWRQENDNQSSPKLVTARASISSTECFGFQKHCKECTAQIKPAGVQETHFSPIKTISSIHSVRVLTVWCKSNSYGHWKVILSRISLLSVFEVRPHAQSHHILKPIRFPNPYACQLIKREAALNTLSHPRELKVKGL